MRRLRSSFLVTLAVLAVTALAGVSTASGAGFEAAKYPASLSGKAESQFMAFGPSWPFFTCGPSFSASLPHRDHSVATTFSPCEDSFHLKYFKTNNCAFSFKPTSTTAATLGVEGEKCTQMELEAKGSMNCQISIPPQSGVKGVTLSSTGSPSKVVISINVSTLTYNSNGGFGCPSKGTHSDGVWSGGWTVSAESPSGTAINLTAVNSIGTGFSLTEGNFVAERYALYTRDSQPGTTKFTGASGMASVTCSSGQYDAELIEANPALTIGLSLNCVDSLGRTVLVQTNGCHLVADATGSAGICPEESKGIELLTLNAAKTTTVCTTTLTPQSGLTGFSYTNVGSGDESGVEVSMAISGMNITTSGKVTGCGTTSGEHPGAGTLSSSFDLFGVAT